MDSGMISKIQKSIEYAKEPDRVEITALSAVFHGNHDTYHLTFADGQLDLPVQLIRAARRVQPHHGHRAAAGAHAQDGDR